MSRIFDKITLAGILIFLRSNFLVLFGDYLIPWSIPSGDSSARKWDTANTTSLLFLPSDRVAATTIEQEPSSSQPIPIFSSDPETRSNNKEDANHSLPSWIVQYAKWHNKMRATFPGVQLFTDPNAPPLLIRACVRKQCGGLHDRLGQLPMDLYLANQTGRVLLFWWAPPLSLEEFLVPNDLLDWSIPTNLQEEHHHNVVPTIRRQRHMFKNILRDGDFMAPHWSNKIDKAIERARTGEFQNITILRHDLSSHRMEHVLEEKLRALGETDMIHSTPSYGQIFNGLFRPSPPIEKQLNSVSSDLGLIPGNYTSVHLRVRFSFVVPEEQRKEIFASKDTKAKTADFGGLPFSGPSKMYAVTQATRALQCSQLVTTRPLEQIYLYSDSNDLVHYFTQDLANTQQQVQAAHHHQPPSDINSMGRISSKKRNWKEEEASLDDSAWLVTQNMSIVSRRNISMEENYHLDRQRGHLPSDYYATFLDLFLAIRARCFVYGAGRYGKFAAKISGSTCQLWYQNNQLESGASTGLHDPQYECPPLSMKKI